MAWYHDEWNKQNELEQATAHKQRVIQQSNFWAQLQRQIEADVAGINESPWKDKLAGMPLTAQPSTGSDGGYVIRKPGYPQIVITLRHQGDYIEVQRDFASIDGVEQYAASEQFTIGSDGKQVYLQNESKKKLAVPEEAAQHILMPIIESLKRHSR